MLQRILNKFSVSTKLYFLVFTLSTFIAVIGAYGLFQLGKMDANTQDIYANRVLCMEQLMNVRYAYAKNIAFTYQELKDGSISYSEARTRMKKAYKDIDSNWRAYKQTYLTAEEAKLAKATEAEMQKADTLIAEERAKLNKSDTLHLQNIAAGNVFHAILPVVDRTNDLMQLQVNVSKDLMEHGSQQYHATRKKFYLLVISALFLGLLLFFTIFFDINGLIENLLISNRKITESEEKLSTFIEHAGDGIIIFDEALLITRVNENACKMLGYPREELLTMTSNDIIAKEDSADSVMKLAILRKNIGSAHERNFRRKDGSLLEAEVNVQPLMGKGFISVMRDITERKKNELELKESEEKYRNLYNNNPSFIGIMDPETMQVIEVNDTIINTYGYSKEEWKTMSAFKYRLKEDQERLLGFVQKILNGGDSVHTGIWHHKKKSGEEMLVDVSYYKMVYNGKIAILSMGKDVTEQSKAENALKQSEEKYRYLFNNNPSYIFIWDPATMQVLEVNDIVLNTYGYSKAEWKNMPVFKYRPPEDKDAIIAFARNMKDEIEEVPKRLWRHIKRSGEEMLMEISTHKIQYDNQLAFLSLGVDVTEQVKAQAELKESIEKNKAVVENISDAIFLMDEKTISSYHSPSVQRILGYSFEDTYGQTVFKFIHPDEVEEARALFEKVAATPDIPFQNHFRVLHKNGNYIWMEGTAVNLIHNSDVRAIILNCRDITERKNAELEIESLNESLEKKVIERTTELKEANTELENKNDEVESLNTFLDTVLENIPSMIFVRDANLRMIRINKAGEKVLGWKKDEIIGKDYYDILPKEVADSYTTTDQEILKKHDVYEIEEQRRTKDDIKWVSTRKLTIRDDEGKPLYLLGITDDITEKRAVEQKIKDLNTRLESNVNQLAIANKELESFSYSVSHDLRTPLTIIHGYAQILADQKGKFDAETISMLQAVADNAIKMADLIDDILEFSKMVSTELKIAPADMRDIADKALEEIIASKGSIKAKVSIKKLLPASADARLMAQIFSNLLSNAIKYSSKKDKPIVEVDSFIKDGEHIYFVKDNGAGFDMNKYDKLFGVFQRLHSSSDFEGTGVGLALVKRIVNRHGGRVWAESILGEGATFYFSLPG